MKFIIATAVALSLSGTAQAQGWTNPYSDTPEQIEAREVKAERDLRMQLMQEQREALRDQKRTMRSQDLRNDLQSLEMLGGRSGGIDSVPPIGY